MKNAFEIALKVTRWANVKNSTYRFTGETVISVSYITSIEDFHRFEFITEEHKFICDYEPSTDSWRLGLVEDRATHFAGRVDSEELVEFLATFE